MQGTNTILIVILILIVVGFGAYWYTQNQATKMDDNSGLEIKLGGDTESN